MMMMNTKYDEVNIVQLIAQTFTVVNHTHNTKRTVEHDSLIIFVETNTFRWFSKQIGGGPEQWFKYVLFADETTIAEITEELDTFVAGTEDTSTFAVQFPIGHIRYHPYFADRRITEATAKTFKLETWLDKVIIPLYNISGHRCGSLIRRLDTNIAYLKYRKALKSSPSDLWPFWLLKERFTKPVFVFEGAWSAMRWYQVSNASIIPLALIGTNVTDEVFELLNGVHNVTFILDNDKTSNAGKTVYERVKRHKLYNKHIGWRFILPTQYPDEMNDETILWYLDYTRRYGL